MRVVIFRLSVFPGLTLKMQKPFAVNWMKRREGLVKEGDENACKSLAPPTMQLAEGDDLSRPSFSTDFSLAQTTIKHFWLPLCKFYIYIEYLHMDNIKKNNAKKFVFML